MNKNQKFFRDCTKYCKSTVHGDIITAAITKRTIPDSELCSYLNYICTNCETVKDSLGRTALHVASSCGRVELVKWLLSVRNANVNLKDAESGYTPLHRSLFYGKINVAVELMKSGANSSVYDIDNLTPLEHVTKDGELPEQDFGSIYTWGLNNNNSLGSFSSRSFPECLDIFHKRLPKARVQQVCLDKFHSLILTTEGEVYSCGHGLGGRLGLGTEKTVVVPTRIDFRSPDKAVVSKASIGRDHCLFLTSDHELYSCGLNKHKVLGLSPPPEKALSPQKIKQLSSKNIEGICTAKFHSVAWTSTNLYTWGLNGGQLGHELMTGNYYVTTPKQVKVMNIGDTDIKKVASSDAAIAVTTGKGDIYVLHEYQCRKIASKILDIADVAIIGGTLSTTLDDMKLETNIELRILVRTIVGNLLLWQESDPQLCRCIFSIPRAIIVKQAVINIHEILFVTNFGEAFKSVIKPRKKKTITDKKNVFHNFLVKDECITLKLSKIPRIHRAVQLACDPRGENYCVIQQNPYNRNLFGDDLPESNIRIQLATLLKEVNEEDNIHDIEVKIGNRVFPAHKYILSHRSKILLSLCYSGEELILKNVNIELFEQMLIYIYTGECDLLKIGNCPEQFRKYCAEYLDSNSPEKNYQNIKNVDNKAIQNPIRMLQEISKRFGCTELYKILSNYEMCGFFIKKKCPSIDVSPVVYQMKDFPEYSDVVLKCSDKKEFKAHKCILAARMEYFKSMFAVRWNNVDKASINIPYTSNIVEAFLEFVYTDSPNCLCNKDCDFLLKLLVVADEYLMTELKNQCIFYLLNLTYLDLKNAVDMLQFAYYYEANSLKQGVMKYIVNNMAYFLEIQALNDLTDDILDDLAQTYYSEKRQICCRVITPYSTAVPDEVIMDINNKYPFDADCPESKKIERTTSKHSKRKGRTSKNSFSENSAKTSLERREEDLDNVVQFPDTVEVVKTPPRYDNNIQKRLSAISSAVQTVECEDHVAEFTILKWGLNSSSSSNDFPLLNSPPERSSPRLNSFGKSAWNKSDNQKITRLSQRERKRLSSESKEPVQAMSESPKNPWKIITPETTTSPIVSPSNKENFCDILSNEKKQRRNFEKMTNKLLIHTQIEDKAIVELEKFYSIDDIEDEIITVQRVDIGFVALPIWTSKNQTVVVGESRNF